MTNRELILKAMPLYNLTNKQWEIFNNLRNQTKDKTVLSILETLASNQSRIETMCIINDFFEDKLDQPVSKTTTEQTTA